MNSKDKKYYDKIVKLIIADDNFDEDQKRYISDLSDSYLFYYPSTGKILESIKDSPKLIFRDKYTCWVLSDKLELILKELEC